MKVSDMVAALIFPNTSSIFFSLESTILLNFHHSLDDIPYSSNSWPSRTNLERVLCTWEDFLLLVSPSIVRIQISSLGIWLPKDASWILTIAGLLKVKNPPRCIKHFPNQSRKVMNWLNDVWQLISDGKSIYSCFQERKRWRMSWEKTRQFPWN